ncbi:MAG: diaminopimelate epimerase [bacterium]
MNLSFTKMHGLGNDMIVLDSLESGFVPGAEQARSMCRRRFGIGADQVLVLLPSDSADFRMLILNSDGSEVEMCGNGIRCLARYIRERGLSDKEELEVETLAGIIRPRVENGLVKVDMGEPEFEASRIPVKGEGKVSLASLSIDDDIFKISAVSMGNPHCVIQVDEVDKVPLETVGPRIETHPWFKNRTNVEFVEVLSKDHIKVRVWERGAGATLACGTGACAAAVVMADLGLADRELTVSLPGGDLEIEWNKESNRVRMSGPAEEVYNGVIELS